MKWSGITHALVALLAHVPCCGSQLLIGIVGVQALGLASFTFFSRYQFIMPVIVAFLLSLLFIAAGRVGRKRDDFLNSPTWKRALARFFVMNLVVGYMMVFFLYFFVPPHHHQNEHQLSLARTGLLLNGKPEVLLQYNDTTRPWPWNIRRFIAPIISDTKAFPARELLWYEDEFRATKRGGKPVPLRLYVQEHEHEHDHGHDHETEHTPVQKAPHNAAKEPPLRYFIEIK